MKKIVSLLIMMSMILCYSLTSVNAATLNTSTNWSYTTTLAGYDDNGYFSLTQGNVTWSGYTANYWPSGRSITYAVFTQDYTQATVGITFTSVGASSGNIYYNSGYAYRQNYRLGGKTNTGSVDTTVSFYV